MGSTIVVRSQVKYLVKKIAEGSGAEKKVKNVSDDVIGVLSKKVEEMVKEAVKRAEANGRTTLMGRDV